MSGLLTLLRGLDSSLTGRPIDPLVREEIVSGLVQVMRAFDAAMRRANRHADTRVGPVDLDLVHARAWDALCGVLLGGGVLPSSAPPRGNGPVEELLLELLMQSMCEGVPLPVSVAPVNGANGAAEVRRARLRLRAVSGMGVVGVVVDHATNGTIEETPIHRGHAAEAYALAAARELAQKGGWTVVAVQTKVASRKGGAR